MKHLIAMLALFLASIGFNVSLADTDDRESIRKVALDYIEGWYTRDALRMERALHPQMIKRLVSTDPASMKSRLDEGSALRLIQATRPVVGRTVQPLESLRRDVQILDVFGNAATVKIDATGWVDYLHMVKWNGEWKILNVLWELRSQE